MQRLRKRYGDRHNYQSLSDQQRALLLDREIAGDGFRGSGTEVCVDEISEDGRLLKLRDVFHFWSQRESRGSAYMYATVHRIPEYKRALKVSEYPKHLEGEKHQGKKYLFELPENRGVEVRFAVSRETV